jgi:hypothetical protein
MMVIFSRKVCVNMDKDKNKFIILIIFLVVTIALIYPLLVDKKENDTLDNNITKIEKDYVLEETLAPPHSFSVADYSRWTEDSNPLLLSEGKINSIIEPITNTEDIESIIDILNSKTYTQITEGEFKFYYKKPDADIRFSLQAYIESDFVDRYLYPYNIFIGNDLSFVIQLGKNYDCHYVKGTITNKDISKIEDIYKNKKEQ